MTTEDVTLHLAKVPTDDEDLLELLVTMARNITGEEPTDEDIAAAREDLGLPDYSANLERSGAKTDPFGF